MDGVGRRRRIAAVLGCLALVCGWSVDPVTAASGPASWRCDAKRLGLGADSVELAPVNPKERTPKGKRITPVADARGKWIPVVLVHGLVGTSTHPAASGKPGAFSHLIDLTAGRDVTTEVPRSLVGALQAVPGAAVFTFDYRDYSGRWVTDEHIGPALGKVVDCLFKASGEKVVLVGHSTGGLVARLAAGSPGLERARTRAAQISTIVTVGTPNQGSILARLVSAGSTGNWRADTVLRTLLAGCRHAKDTSPDVSGACGILPYADAFDGADGRALRAGSPELAALPAYPKGVNVVALAGKATVSAPQAGWFGADLTIEDVPIGDVVLTPGSAVKHADEVTEIACAYRLRPAKLDGDAHAVTISRKATKASRESGLESFAGSCFHPALLRDVTLTKAVLGAIDDDIEDRLHARRVLPRVDAGVAQRLSDLLRRRALGMDMRTPDECTTVQVYGADLDHGDIDLYVGIPGGSCGGDAAGTAYGIRDGRIVRQGDACGDCGSVSSAYRAIVDPYRNAHESSVAFRGGRFGWPLVYVPQWNESGGDVLLRYGEEAGFTNADGSITCSLADESSRSISCFVRGGTFSETVDDLDGPAPPDLFVFDEMGLTPLVTHGEQLSVALTTQEWWGWNTPGLTVDGVDLAFLVDGRSLSNQLSRCEPNNGSVTCTMESGHGFTLSRSTYRTF